MSTGVHGTDASRSTWPAVDKNWIVRGRDMVMHLVNDAKNAVNFAGHRVICPVETVALRYLTHGRRRFLHARRQATHMHVLSMRPHCKPSKERRFYFERKISQGKVAKAYRWGRPMYKLSTSNFLRISHTKNNWKQLIFRKSYSNIKKLDIFWDTV